MEDFTRDIWQMIFLLIGAGGGSAIHIPWSRHIGTRSTGSIPDGGGSMYGGSECMSRNVSSCHCLPCGTGSRTGWIALLHLTGSCHVLQVKSCGHRSS
jgi:hypothetical protein